MMGNQGKIDAYKLMSVLQHRCSTFKEYLSLSLSSFLRIKYVLIDVCLICHWKHLKDMSFLVVSLSGVLLILPHLVLFFLLFCFLRCLSRTSFITGYSTLDPAHRTSN